AFSAEPAASPAVPEEWLDEGFSLYMVAPTIKELAAKTHADDVTHQDQPFFIWIHPNKSTFSFTVAEANKLPNGQWCLLNGGNVSETMLHYPRTTITRAVERTPTLLPVS